MPPWFFNGISPPGGAFANGNNPAFWLLRTQSVVSSPGVLTNLAETLTDGRSIVDLSAGMALTNILNRLKIGSTHTYNIVEVVGPSLILTAGAYNFVRHFTFIPDMLSSIGSKLAGHLTASVVVSAESGLNDDVCSWVVAQNSGQHARSLILAPPSGQDFEDEESDDGRDGCVQADQAKAPLNYLPSFGTTDFQYNGYRMTLHRTAATVVTDFDGKVTKVQEGEVNKAKNITPIEEFLDHVRDFAVPSHNNVVEICRPEREGPDECDFYWKSVYRPARDLDGVVMQSAVKNTLVSDIDFYLSRACRTFYENRGIPCRRGYLFYGPPGTDKTSISVSLASAYKLPLYVLNLNDLTDKSLMRLLNFVPKRSILLLEDVDSAGLDREHMLAGAVGRDGKPTAAKKKTVTLSGLLNCLDGPASVDGRLLIMTSDSPDSLDAALVRPGRTTAELYKDKKSASDEHDIPAMALHFASEIPTDAAITPAEVQAWLLSNRTDPVVALEGAAEWVKEIIETKLRGANVAKFTNEVKSFPSTSMPDTPPTSSRAPSETADLEDFDFEASDLEGFDE